MTDGFDLNQAVSPGQQCLAAFEQVALEIGSQSVGHHRDIQAIADIAQLEDLQTSQELRLIDQDAMDLAILKHFFDRKKLSRSLNLKPRCCRS